MSPRAAVLVALCSSLAFAHEGHFTNVAWAACAQASLGQACSFEDGAQNLYRGSCRSMSGALVCVRHRPLERRGGVEGWGLMGLGLLGAALALVLNRKGRPAVTSPAGP